MSNEVAALYEEVIMLCEIRGELDEETNARTEAKIAAIMKRIKELE